MITTTLTKKTFWTKVGRLYDQLQSGGSASFVVISKDHFDPDRVTETPKNKQAYQKSIKGLNKSYSLDDAYSIVMQGVPTV